MLDWHDEYTLCDQDLTTVGMEVIEARMRQLSDAEAACGFVYEGELQWMSDFVAQKPDRTYSIYGDWACQVLECEVLDAPFQWAVHGGLFVDPGERDKWTGAIDWKCRLLPRFPGFDWSRKYNRWLYEGHEFLICGGQKSPDPAYVRCLFEKLHNLPYYYLAHQEIFEKQEDEEEPSFCGIEIDDPANHLNWSIDRGPGCRILYLSGRNLREPECATTPGFRDAFIACLTVETCPDYEKIVNWPEFDHDVELQRCVLRYLHLLSEEQARSVIDDLWRHSKFEMGIPTKTHALLIGAQVTCRQCHTSQTATMGFQWGDIANFPEYELGDSIRWGLHNAGHQECKTVYVCVQSVKFCCACNGRIETLLKIEDNVIEGWADKKAAAVKYLHEGPFMTNRMIPFEKFESDWVEQLFGERATWENFFGFHLMERCLEQFHDSLRRHNCQPDEFGHGVDGHWIHEFELVRKWLFHRNRHLFGEGKHRRLMNHLEAGFYNSPVVELPTLETPVKSFSVLRDIDLDGESFNFHFIWGSMLNFREYRVGDYIEWSDYSFGDRTARKVVAIGTSISGTIFHSVRAAIHIEDNRIVSVRVFVTNPAKKMLHNAYRDNLEGQPFQLWPEEVADCRAFPRDLRPILQEE